MRTLSFVVVLLVLASANANWLDHVAVFDTYSDYQALANSTVTEWLFDAGMSNVTVAQTALHYAAICETPFYEVTVPNVRFANVEDGVVHSGLGRVFEVCKVREHGHVTNQDVLVNDTLHQTNRVFTPIANITSPEYLVRHYGHFVTGVSKCYLFADPSCNPYCTEAAATIVQLFQTPFLNAGETVYNLPWTGGIIKISSVCPTNSTLLYVRIYQIDNVATLSYVFKEVVCDGFISSDSGQTVISFQYVTCAAVGCAAYTPTLTAYPLEVWRDMQIQSSMICPYVPQEPYGFYFDESFGEGAMMGYGQQAPHTDFPDRYNFSMSRALETCYSLSMPVVTCDGDDCIATTVYSSCDHQVAFITLAGVDDSCLVAPTGNCTLPFHHGDTTIVVFHGRVGSVSFESAQKMLTRPVIWRWACAPWCGVKYLETLDSFWRWFIAVATFVFVYLVLGALFTRISWVYGFFGTAGSGWSSTIKIVWGIFVKIGLLALLILNLFTCGALTRVISRFRSGPSDVSRDIPLRSMSRSSSSRSSSSSSSDNKGRRSRKKLSMLSMAMMIPGVLGALDNTSGSVLRPPPGGHLWDITGDLAALDADTPCSVIPVSSGSIGTLVNSSMVIQMTPTVGNSACMEGVVTNGTISSTVYHIQMTTIGFGFAYPPSTVRVGQPHIAIHSSCQCPTGGASTCEQYAPCPVGTQCYYASKVGPKDGCGAFNFGDGHYCWRLATDIHAPGTYECTQYSLSEGTPIVIVAVTTNHGTPEIWYIDPSHEGTITTSLGKLTYHSSGYSADTTKLTTGSAYRCGSSSFWDSSPVVSWQEPVPRGHPGFYQRYNNQWWSPSTTAGATLTATQCIDVSSAIHWTDFDFHGAYASERELSKHFQSSGHVSFGTDDYLYIVEHNPPDLTFALEGMVPISPQADIASCTIASVAAIGSFNTTSSGLLVKATCDSYGPISITVNSQTMNFVATPNTTAFVFPIVLSEKRLVSIATLCSRLSSHCDSKSFTLDFDAPLVVPYSKNAGVTVSGPEQHDFFENGVGAAMRPSKLFSFSLPIWADVLIFVFIALAGFVIFRVGAALVSKKPRVSLD